MVEYLKASLGPYDPTTPEGRAANLGVAAYNATADGSIFRKNVQIAFTNKDNNWDPSISLAFAKEDMKTLDAQGTADKPTSDGQLTVDDNYWGNIANNINSLSADTRKQFINPALLNDKGEFDKQAYFDQFDLNDDKKIDAAEYTAYEYYMDTPSNYTAGDSESTAYDGVVSGAERFAGYKRVLSDPNAKADMTTIRDSLGLQKAQENYKEPSKLPYDSSTLEGQGANAGYVYANAEYQYGDGYQYGLDNDQRAWSKESSLAFSEEAKERFDGVKGDDGKVNKDGKVTIDDDYWNNLTTLLNNQPDEVKRNYDPSLINEDGVVTKENLFKKFDINDNDVYDATDDAVINCYFDRSSLLGSGVEGTANDGILTQSEIDAGQANLIMNWNSSNDLSDIYNQYGLSDVSKNFKMPDRISQ